MRYRHALIKPNFAVHIPYVPLKPLVLIVVEACVEEVMLRLRLDTYLTSSIHVDKLNERVITNSTIALQDSHRITITVVTLA